MGEELAEDLFGRRRSGKKKEMSVSVPKCKLEDCRETRGSISEVSERTPYTGNRMMAYTGLKRYFQGKWRFIKRIKLDGRAKTVNLIWKTRRFDTRRKSKQRQERGCRPSSFRIKERNTEKIKISNIWKLFCWNKVCKNIFKILKNQNQKMY